MLALAKFSLGIGDRFAQQGRAQLQAFVPGAGAGAAVARNATANLFDRRRKPLFLA